MTTPKKILVIDDDPDIGTLIKMILENKSYAVAVVDNISMLPQALAEKRFNLLIIDMLLSGTDGKKICNAVKQQENSKDIPIIMTSAYPQAKEICLSSGANDFISKPFDMHDLISKVNRLIDTNPERAES